MILVVVVGGGGGSGFFSLLLIDEFGDFVELATGEPFAVGIGV